MPIGEVFTEALHGFGLTPLGFVTVVVVLGVPLGILLGLLLGLDGWVDSSRPGGRMGRGR